MHVILEFKNISCIEGNTQREIIGIAPLTSPEIKVHDCEETKVG